MIATRRSWGAFKPPLGAQINWSHPLARGLVGVWLFNEGAGSSAFDRVRQNTATLTNGPTWFASTMGLAISFTAANSHYLAAAANLTLPRFSLVARVYKLTTGVQSVIAESNAAVNILPFFFRINATSGFTSAAGTFREVTVPDITLNEWRSVALTYDQVNLKFYDNGIETATAAQTNTPQTDTTLAPRIGRLGDFDGQYWNGYKAFVFAYDRGLLPGEVMHLHTAPYAFLAPPAPYRRWFSPRAAAAPSATIRPLITVGAIRRLQDVHG